MFNRRSLPAFCLVYTILVSTCLDCLAEVSVPNIFSHHMVLQQQQANKVWGRAAPGEAIAVAVADQEHRAVTNSQGDWQVMLEPLAAGGPHRLQISCSTNTIEIEDVLVGEVWLCSGQSNMRWTVQNSADADLAKATAERPRLRMINFPNHGSQKPAWTHPKASWAVCSADTVGEFSAVGYYFGCQLQQALGVPIGLVNNAWGGSAIDAWIDRRLLADDPVYKPTLQSWVTKENRFAELNGKENLSEEQLAEQQALRKLMKGNARPGNIYNGVLRSHLGYGIRGAIWYQGETNSGRAYQYRKLFPLMIGNWREQWQQGDFPFYWVQLADFKRERPQPGESAWAELREAQTMALDKLANVGQAVIIDLGEGKDIHPRNKLAVARRLARWALANDYNLPVAYRSPQFESLEIAGSKALVTCAHIDQGWRPFDVSWLVGFTIAGKDKQFVRAKAKILQDNRIEVFSDQVADPVAVRYAWADNPRCNLYDGAGLPLTPFRTDEWPGVTLYNR